MNRWIVTLAVMLMPAMASAAPTPGECRSMTGIWTGHFDGPVSGVWTATFTQDGVELTATATVTANGVELLGAGSATVGCDAGIVSLAGTGKGGGRSGAFNGVANAKGDIVSGNWVTGQLRGTWSGKRANPELPAGSE